MKHSIAHGIATTPVTRELAEGRWAVALPLVVMGFNIMHVIGRHG